MGGYQVNQVSLSAYNKDNVIGFRRIKRLELTTLPDSILKIGDRGNAVKKLQVALKTEGFNCGTSDGDFGTKTENAEQEMQAYKHGLTIDGVFKTRELLFDLMNK